MEKVIKVSQIKEIIDEQTAFYLDWHIRGIITLEEFEARRQTMESMFNLSNFRAEKLETKEIA